MTKVLASLTIFALLVVLSGCDGEKGDIHREGDTMTLEAPKPPEKLTRCIVTSSQGMTYELFPNNTSPGSYYGRAEKCSIEANNIPLSYAGLWTIETITANTRIRTEFSVKMEQRGITKPADKIRSSAGQWATLWLDSNSDNLTHCNLIDPQSEIHDLMKEETTNLTRVHGCGVRMLVSPKMQGQWTFSAQFGDYLIKTAIFHISIPYERKNNDMMHKMFEIGRPAKLELYELGGGFCQLTKPDGTKVPLILGSCVYDIPSVSLYHSGIWKVAYPRSEKLELNRVEINVTTIDPNLVEGFSTFGVGNEVNLLCRTGLKKLEFCTFIRPDEHILNIPASLGNDKYSYYGHGYQERNAPNREYSECGLTIRNPSAEDYGLWTCQMGTDKTIQGAVIDVANERKATEIIEADNSKVFVKRGDDFTIRCSANAVLSYCWLTSPNGTDYSVSSVKADARTLMYDGKGFSMGECGAIVRNANDTDKGEWICHLGIADETGELETTVEVKVAESYVAATEDTVHAQPNATLSCRTFPDAEASIQHCRWLRPNGHGINEKEAWRYDLRKTMSECYLTILTLEPEDIGRWRCVTSFSRVPSNEEWATIDLKATDGETEAANALSIALCSGLLVIALIGTIFAAMRIYKKKNGKVTESPPPYYPEDYNIPKVRATSESTDQKKGCAC